MKRYQVEDPENVSGILEDEVKKIEEYLPSLPWPSTFNEKEQAQLNQFREAVKDHIHNVEGHYLHTDLYLSRFLYARDWNMEASVEMFIKAMTWRTENDIENITQRFESSPYYPLFKAYWPSSVMRKDDNYWTYDNTPVAYDALGKIDSQILHIISAKDIVQFHVYCLEQIEKKFAEQYKRFGSISGCVMVLDLDGLSMDGLGLMDCLKEVTSIDENYYPCSLRRCIVINAPGIFSVFWAIAKTFLDERVIKKIDILGSDRDKNEAYLKNIIPSRFIPKLYGGESTIVLPVAGSCKDLGKDLPMEIGQTRKVIISRNQVIEHKVEHNQPDKKLLLKWEFMSEDQIRFGITYKKSHGDEKEKPKQIMKIEKAKNSHKEKKAGEFEVDSVGYYYITFHNDTFLYETSVTYYLSWIHK